jgi:hypothetical protein
VHADDDVHATLFKKADWAPAGVGVGWMSHLVPFQASARVPALEFPAAMHADADTQDTPFKPPPPCGGLGVAWMVHLAPFHASASVPPLNPPTAVQADGEAHDTALRPAPPPGGLGVVWICQAAPFHRSTRAWEAPAMVLDPTAVQAEDVLHATPSSAANVDRGGFGVRKMRHLVPSHRSARLAPCPDAATCAPTAMHEFTAVHDAQNSWPVGISGLGLGVTDHPAPEALAGAANTPIRSTGTNSNTDLFIAIPSRPYG